MARNDRSDGAAFVVGGSGGLGTAICRALANEFEAVFFTYRSNRQAAEALASELVRTARTGFAPLDITDSASVSGALAAATETFGTVPAVILASGAHIAQPYVSQIGESQWLDVIQTELLGFTRLVAAALPVFRRQEGGAFVSLTSVATRSYPPGDALSSVPKAGIEALSRAVAKEEGRYGIRANCVAPGIIDAGLGEAFLKELHSPQIWEGQRKRIALQRFGKAEEVAEVVTFLATEKSRYVTGQTILADGGFHL
ncbi:SDR family oxidoreductase [Chelativorans sp. ZYF759]|uniref:SDR family NAD(P)-dependent oxidoreductase n=1 Tax=Chelativorans sp. ZYF759 TaxID=2692213 RepID=UPI00145F3A81|nr:SDR family oxidoreductase [Chelativorans sp. ZYF759]NMG41670.1 SDR family oxidoreductase [Chelativorans sp. ZYF759]